MRMFIKNEKGKTQPNTIPALNSEVNMLLTTFNSLVAFSSHVKNEDVIVTSSVLFASSKWHFDLE